MYLKCQKEVGFKSLNIVMLNIGSWSISGMTKVIFLQTCCLRSGSNDRWFYAALRKV